jgi:AcrR family transcriptional regulator
MELERPASAGLRERKKARTHTEIREHALRLFLQRGYEATTVKQIADAAEVSVSTLFRYFPTKAQLVVNYDLEALVRQAVEAQRPDDTVFDAIESALLASFEEISPVGGRDGNDADSPATVGHAREAFLGQAAGRVGVFAALIGARWRRDAHDSLVQAAAGAVVGVAIAAWSADRDVGRATALEILHVGLQGLEKAFLP